MDRRAIVALRDEIGMMDPQMAREVLSRLTWLIFPEHIAEAIREAIGDVRDRHQKT